MKDLTEIIEVIQPGSLDRVKRWGSEGEDLWDLSSPTACQATMDDVCTFNEGVIEPTGQQVFDQIPIEQQKEEDAEAYKLTEDYQDDLIEKKFDVSNVDKIILKVLLSHENRIRTQVEGKTAVTMKPFIRKIRKL